MSSSYMWWSEPSAQACFLTEQESIQYVSSYVVYILRGEWTLFFIAISKTNPEKKAGSCCLDLSRWNMRWWLSTRHGLHVMTKLYPRRVFQKFLYKDSNIHDQEYAHSLTDHMPKCTWSKNGDIGSLEGHEKTKRWKSGHREEPAQTQRIHKWISTLWRYLLNHRWPKKHEATRSYSTGREITAK